MVLPTHRLFSLEPLNGFPDSSRIWSFVGSKILAPETAIELEMLSEQFCRDWKAHNQPLHSKATLTGGCVLIFAADEAKTEVSGCATDSLFRFVRNLDQQFGTQFLKRDNYLIRYNDLRLETVVLRDLQNLTSSERDQISGIFRTEESNLGILRKKTFTNGIPDELLELKPAFSGGLL